MGGDFGGFSLAMPALGVQDEPELPDVTRINGRDAEEWEQDRILAARLDRRQEAADLLSGVSVRWQS